MTDLEFDRHNLRVFLIENFSDDDIRDLCFDLEIDYEELEGENKSSKIRQLILYCENRGLIEKLERCVRENRDDSQIHHFLVENPKKINQEIISAVENSSNFQNVTHILEYFFIDEDAGLFELNEIWRERFKEAAELTKDLTANFSEYSAGTEQLNIEIDRLTTHKPQLSKNQLKQINYKRANIIDQLATKNMPKINDFEEVSIEGLIAYLREASIWITDFGDVGQNKVQKMSDSLIIDFRDPNQRALETDNIFLEGVNQIPRMTKPIVKAKRNLLSVTGDQIKTREKILELTLIIEKLLGDMLFHDN